MRGMWGQSWLNFSIVLEVKDDTSYNQVNTVKPAYVVTSIKESPALSSHIFWVP